MMNMRHFPSHFVPDYGSELWLPIDEVIKKIASRNKRPRLRSKTEESHYSALVWRVYGPHDLARGHLQIAFSEIASLAPRMREINVEDTRRFLDNCCELRHTIKDFADIEVSNIPHFEAIMRGISSSERPYRHKVSERFADCLAEVDSYLGQLETWAREAYDMISPPQGGKPKSEWKHEFVFRVGHLWFLLTGDKAPSGPNTIFMDFLEAAWASGGESMPDVTWEATVRTVNSHSNREVMKP